METRPDKAELVSSNQASGNVVRWPIEYGAGMCQIAPPLL